MRRLFFITIFILITLSLNATSFGIAVDAVSADSFFVDSKGARVDTYYNLTEDVRLNLLLGFASVNKPEVQLSAIEAAFSMDYFPFEKANAYIGTSVIRANYLFGFDSPKNKFVFLTDVRIGYQVKIKNFYIEPRLTITNLEAFSSGENEILSKNFYQYAKYRISLFLGYSF